MWRDFLFAGHSPDIPAIHAADGGIDRHASASSVAALFCRMVLDIARLNGMQFSVNVGGDAHIAPPGVGLHPCPGGWGNVNFTMSHSTYCSNSVRIRVDVLNRHLH